MNKLLIVNKGTRNEGKSTSIKKAFKILSQKYPIIKEFNDGDIRAIIDIRGVKVGIESQGDPNSRMSQSMDYFIEKECDIIITACRTKGDTINKVYELHNKYGFDLIWSANDRYLDKGDKNTIKILNEQYANRIVQIIEDRINGII